MKKINSFLLIFLCSHFAIGQTTSFNYWVEFKDKNGSSFSLSSPTAYLSQKAIDRRSKQNIPVSINDLPVNYAYVSEIKAMGAIIINQSRWFNAILLSCSDTGKIISIEALPYVKSIKKMEGAQLTKTTSKFKFESVISAVNSEKYDNPSAASGFDYGPSFKQSNQIGADCLHNLGYHGQGITIAVLDAGFFDVNILHVFDSLRINDQLLGTRDFISGDTMVYEDFPHGMNVLSCMAGNLPGKLVGTAPKAKYWLLRTEDASSESLSEEIAWAVGAEFADSVGADIINSSLGYNYFDNPADNHSYADLDGNTTIITKAADVAASKGIMVVSSAGNFGGPPWYKISAPADADSILSVGAVDSAGAIGSLSSRGPSFDGRVKPNTVARGMQAIIAGNSGDITSSSGTSFSSPITAGAVACLWQANPNATNMELLYAIHQSSSQSSNPDSIKGYGIPNFCAANTILTGIEKPELNADKLSIHPNPFNDNINITFYSIKQQTVFVELYDISGRIIFKNSENVNANTSNIFNIPVTKTLSKGLYLLQLTAPNKSFYKKVIKK